MERCWKVYNSGDKKWPHGCRVAIVEGTELFHLRDEVIVPPLDVNQRLEVRCYLSCSEVGVHECSLKIFTPSGTQFAGTTMDTSMTVKPANVDKNDLAEQFRNIGLK